MSIFSKIMGIDGMTRSDLKGMTYRNKFSKFLPYEAYDPKEQMFHNNNETFGFIWECTPLVSADNEVFRMLEGMIQGSSVPSGSVMQFILYADPYVKPYLDWYQDLKVRALPMVEKSVEHMRNLFEKGTKDGIKQMAGIPVRNFRLFVALQLPEGCDDTVNPKDLRDDFTELLKGAHLHPNVIGPEVLINFLAKVFNDEVPENLRYDEHREINRQIILSETVIKSKWDKIMIGKKHLRCQTVHKLPETINELTANHLVGDMWGVTGDMSQLNSPFLLTVNVVFQPLRAKLHRKCGFVLKQQAIGSFAPSLRRKQQEYMEATGELEKGTPYVRVMPILWQFADNDSRSREVAARGKNIWKSKGFVPQKDCGILKILLLSALPFGLTTKNKTVDYIDRDFILPPPVAARLLPAQVDFAGGGAPHCLFMGRKGQIVPFDLFSNQANNYNALICATSGAGKSFFTNYLAFNYYAGGAKLRIIDIGGSYKKLCEVVGGNFINFSKDSNLCLNPFTNIRDFDEDIIKIAAIIAQMVYSSTQQTPTESEMTLIKAAIRTSWQEKHHNADIDTVYDCLREPTKSFDDMLELECDDSNTSCVADLKRIATTLAFNLRAFTSAGEHGKWFNGPSTLNIESDDFVVLELQELKENKELFKVITLQVLNYVTSNLYLSDRQDPRMIIFDEAWQFFTEDSKMLTDIIVSGYRTARKHYASFTCITQSILDIELFGDTGQVIFSNSATKIYLESGDYEKAQRKGVIDYGDFTMQLLKSVRSPKPRYSEVFIDSPVGRGIARLLVDPFNYFLFTSDAKDNTKIEQLVSQKFSFAEAIEFLVAQKDKQSDQPREPADSCNQDGSEDMKIAA